MGWNEVLKSGRMTKYQYVAAHTWVKKTLGKDSLCENCGSTNAKRYDWANISGDYLKDSADWARLCRSCHILIDGREANSKALRPLGNKCNRGHLYTDENTRWRNQAGLPSRVCKACARIHVANHYAKQKARKESL